jgi:hypothetical protein
VDGANDSNQGGRTIMQQPSVDEIEEFKVQTSNMSAQFGYSSTVVNVAIRSGTNRLHGSAYEFHRNDALDARSFFASRVEPLKRNQFGATFGGPVYIPGLYKGRDKTFFFLSYEGLRLRQGSVFVATVPTERMRMGDFSEWPSPLYDPQSTAPDAATPGGFVRARFSNNQIPLSRYNSVARYFLDPAWIPLPNRPGVVNNLQRELGTPSNNDQGTVKIDHLLTSKDSLSGRFSLTEGFFGSLGPYHGFTPVDPGANPKTVAPKNATISWTRTFSPRDLLETRATYTRGRVLFDTPNQLDRDLTTELGIQGFLPFSAEDKTYPVMSITGMTGLPRGFVLSYATNQFEYTANYTALRGRHTFKMGETYRTWAQNTYADVTAGGTFNFSGNYTNNPASPGGTGGGIADFVLGVPTSGSRFVTGNRYYQRMRNNWTYFEDTWRGTQNLTLTLGLRYELNFPTYEKNGHFSNFCPTCRSGRGGIVVPDAESVRIPNAIRVVDVMYPAYRDFVVFSDDVGFNHKYLRNPGRHSWAPRIGLAYRLPRSTVIRAGYGIYWLNLDGNRMTEVESPPFTIREGSLLNDPFIPTKTIQNLVGSGPPFLPNPDLTGHDPNATDFGYSQQWNFAIQKQLPGELAVEVAYVGSKGTRLWGSRNINAPIPGPGAFQPRRPYQDFSNVGWQEFSAYSIYHSFQLKAERRFSKGFSLLTAFTWSKNIDSNSDDSQGLNPFDPNLNRGPSSFDSPRVFTLAAIYEFPFARNDRGMKRALLGGWNLAPLVTMRDGFPFTVNATGDPTNSGIGTRANAVAGCNPKLGDPTPQLWFNTSCFTVPPGPPSYVQGNAGRNTVRGDAYKNVDVGLYKTFPLFSEQTTLQLRFEAFNLLNQHSFAFPAATIGSPGVGTIAASSPGRILQAAGKIAF